MSIAVMTYRSIHGSSPPYRLQSNCFTRVGEMASRPRLPSSTSHRLDVPPVRLSTVGRRAFSVSGATVWTTCLSTLHLRRHSRFSDNYSKPFCFPVHIKTLSHWLVCYYLHSYLLSVVL